MAPRVAAVPYGAAALRGPAEPRAAVVELLVSEAPAPLAAVRPGQLLRARAVLDGLVPAGAPAARPEAWKSVAEPVRVAVGRLVAYRLVPAQAAYAVRPE
ncbi:MAG TPA: hypothetical protein VKR61_06190, partial [Bryobacteraceae bacterium]|nr:hypothetical protein [Bryobacteraceae bacterium]